MVEWFRWKPMISCVLYAKTTVMVWKSSRPVAFRYFVSWRNVQLNGKPLKGDTLYKLQAYAMPKLGTLKLDYVSYQVRPGWRCFWGRNLNPVYLAYAPYHVTCLGTLAYNTTGWSGKCLVCREHPARVATGVNVSQCHMCAAMPCKTVP